MNCKICGNRAEELFKAKILNKYDIKYFYCRQCHFLFTEDPYWLDEAYKSPINISDTGYLQRNISLSKKVSVLLSLFFNRRGKFLDYAGGYGVFVRLMRDYGFDFYWYDKNAENIFARGFEHKPYTKYEVVTTFESFEHFVDPVEELENMLNFSQNIVFTTELLPDPVPEPESWWYYGLDHGQHISFYSEKTFQYLSKKYGLKYYNLNGLFLLIAKDIPFYAKFILKFSKLGLHKLFLMGMKGKTLDDYYYIKSIISENKSKVLFPKTKLRRMQNERN